MMQIQRVEFEQAREEYEALLAGFEGGFSVELAEQWEALRSRCSTWTNWAMVQFSLDTESDHTRADQDQASKLGTLTTGFDTKIKRLFANSPEAERYFTTEVVRRWRVETNTFSPQVTAMVNEEKSLVNNYRVLVASASLEINGEPHSLTTLGALLSDDDRQVRYAATAARYKWYAENGHKIEKFFGDLVTLRTQIAHTLGLKNMVELGYNRMGRTDFGPVEVARFREEILKEVVPFVAELRAQQAKELSLGRLMAWDESVFSQKDNPMPQGDLMHNTHTALHEIDVELGEFFDEMNERKMLDLFPRKGKGGGGFYMPLPEVKWPFIFANFTGTSSDVTILVHELGHAYQARSSTKVLPFIDQWLGGEESAEIHSTSLEYLIYPVLHHFFGDGASQAMKLHFKRSICRIPYVAAIDHFQHKVYENPTASHTERRQMWREVEQLYLPWRDYGDLTDVVDGGVWQIQSHLFFMPFYYIDYALAKVVALQFWERAEEDHAVAVADYKTLCHLGASYSFEGLVKQMNMRSPFEPGCLRSIVERARQFACEPA